MRRKIHEVSQKYTHSVSAYFNRHKRAFIVSLWIAFASLFLPTIPYVNLYFPQKVTGAIVLFSVIMLATKRILAAIFFTVLFISFFVLIIDPSSTETLGYILLMIIVAGILKSLLGREEDEA